MPGHLAVEGRVLALPELLALSAGRVTNPEAFNYLTRAPERGGLHCAEIFGPADWKAIAADCSADDRRERWGHIELGEAFAHPLRRDATIACVLVLPPGYRRWRTMQPEESRERARRWRAEILATPERELGDPPEKLLAEAGLLEPADVDALGVTWEEHPLNTLYRGVINRSRRAKRLRELGAPAQVQAGDREKLAAEIADLFEALVARREELGPANLLRALGMAAL